MLLKVIVLTIKLLVVQLDLKLCIFWSAVIKNHKRHTIAKKAYSSKAAFIHVIAIKMNALERKRSG